MFKIWSVEAPIYGSTCLRAYAAQQGRVVGFQVVRRSHAGNDAEETIVIGHVYCRDSIISVWDFASALAHDLIDHKPIWNDAEPCFDSGCVPKLTAFIRRACEFLSGDAT